MKKILLVLCLAVAANACDYQCKDYLSRIAVAVEKIANQKQSCPQQPVKTEIIVKDESWKQYPRSSGKNRPNLKAEPTVFNERLDRCAADCENGPDSLKGTCLQKCIDLYQ